MPACSSDCFYALLTTLNFKASSKNPTKKFVIWKKKRSAKWILSDDKCPTLPLLLPQPASSSPIQWVQFVCQTLVVCPGLKSRAAIFPKQLGGFNAERQPKVAPCSSSALIQVFGRAVMPNWFEKADRKGRNPRRWVTKLRLLVVNPVVMMVAAKEKKRVVNRLMQRFQNKLESEGCFFSVEGPFFSFFCSFYFILCLKWITRMLVISSNGPWKTKKVQRSLFKVYNHD